MGAKPASRQTCSVISRQPAALDEQIHASSERSASFRPAALDERMVERQNRVVGVVDQVLELQLGGQRRAQRLVVVDERQVGLAGLQALRRLVRLGLDHAQFDAGVALVELRHRAWDERGAGALEAGQPQATAAQARDRGQLLLGGLDAGEDRIRVLAEGATGVGESYAARAALDELRADLALERGDVLADRGLREVERLGGGGEGAAGGHLAQDAHTTDVEHQSSLSRFLDVFI